MAKQIKIEVASGEIMYADLLEDLAPKTCQAFLADLPYENKILGHAKFSGHVLSVFTDMTLRIPECSRAYGVCPGDILYNPHTVDEPEHPHELSIVYGPAALRNIAGFAVSNLFARIHPTYLPMLYKLGIDVNRYGERPVRITVEL